MSIYPAVIVHLSTH